jgi:phenylacetate-CoA ligase
MPHAQEQRETLEALLRDRLRLMTNLRYDLEFHEYGTLPSYAVKAKRFKDLR